MTREASAGALGERAARRERLAALPAMLALAAALALPCGAARAQDATWLASPTNGDFNTGGNWDTNTVPTGTAFFDTSSIISLSFSADTSIGGWTFNTGASAYKFTNSHLLKFTGAGIVINGGSASITNNLALQFLNASTAGSATITNNGDVYFDNTSTAGSATITNTATNTNIGAVYFFATSTAGSATISNSGSVYFENSSTAGSATINNNNLLVFYNTSTAGSATITTNLGSISIEDQASGGTARFILSYYGVLDISGLTTNGTTAGSIEGGGYPSLGVLLGSKNLTVGGNNRSTTFSGVIQDGGNFGGGGGSLTKEGTGTLTLTGANTYTGGTTINGGTLQLGNGGTSGSILGNVTNNGTFAIDRSDTFTFGNVISGTGAFQQNGSGTTILTGTNTYTGATTVNAGTLRVDGSLANTSGVTVNSGATLTGFGTVDPTTTTTINSGGTLAPGTPGTPGTFMTITGNLAFQPGATYAVSLDPSSTTYAVVGGAASLAGTLNAAFASGSYVAKQQYDILQSAGLGGTTFNTLATSGLPAGFATSVSYSSTDVFLNLTAALGAQQGLHRNQQNVANAINNFFNNGGTLPAGFSALFGLTGNSLAEALSQLSGEAATGAQQTAFQLMNEFFELMFGQDFAGQGGALPTTSAIGYAAQAQALPDEVAQAYASALKAPPAPSFAQRWRAWASGFGGYNEANGNASVGYHDITARTYGGAAGLDYRITPDTILGIALAGAGSNWGLADGLGGGHSDDFQAGLYGRSHAGAAYVAAALAFASHWMSTDRYAQGDHLTADFTAYSFGGRIEGGYRFGTAMQAIAPYAALQAQSFHAPGYSETDLSGGGFGLSYASNTATDTRSELGARFEEQLPTVDGETLSLSARAAWAHDWESDPSLTATFWALPGASFIVNGAPPPENSALVSAGAQLRLANGMSLLAKFDGDFAGSSQTYAGSGTLRYTW